MPSAIGRPDAVRIGDGRPPRVVSLLYRAGPRVPEPAASGSVAARLDEFAGRSTPVFGKFAAIDADVVRVTIEGQPGIWVAGPHEVMYIDRHGEWRTASARLAANTLIWQVGGVTMRLEGEFSKAAALDIARSVR